MADSQDLLRLADELEKATGPDRGLDGAITKALGEFPCWATVQKDRQPELFTDGKPGLRAREWLCPKYTASLDAAMTLAPEGWYLRVEPRFYSEEGQVRWRAHAIRPDWSRWTPYDDWFATIENIDSGQPALALCAAALRARAHSTKESDNG